MQPAGKAQGQGVRRRIAGPVEDRPDGRGRRGQPFGGEVQEAGRKRRAKPAATLGLAAEMGTNGVFALGRRHVSDGVVGTADAVVLGR